LRRSTPAFPQKRKEAIQGEAVQSGKIDFLDLEKMDEETIIETLTKVKGIGRWTAEMYLMFSMGRLDVFPKGDMAIRNAMCFVYDMNEANFETRAEGIAARWRPFRTIGCWYLYRYLDVVNQR